MGELWWLLWWWSSFCSSCCKISKYNSGKSALRAGNRDACCRVGSVDLESGPYAVPHLDLDLWVMQVTPSHQAYNQRHCYKRRVSSYWNSKWVPNHNSKLKLLQKRNVRIFKWRNLLSVWGSTRACSLNCRVIQTALKKSGPDFGAALYNGSNLPAAVSPARKGRKVLKCEIW